MTRLVVEIERKLFLQRNFHIFNTEKMSTFKIGANPDLGAMFPVTKVAPKTGSNCIHMYVRMALIGQWNIFQIR